MSTQNLRAILARRPTGEQVFVDSLLDVNGKPIGNLLRTPTTVQACFISEATGSLALTEIFVDPEKTQKLERISGDIAAAFARADHKKQLTYGSK